MILVGDYIPQSREPICDDISTNEIVLANLEGPICSPDIAKATQAGPHLRSDRFEVRHNWVFSLSNNHLMDYGEEGYRQTIDYLNGKSIPFVGAGANLAEAMRPIVVDENGVRIAIFSCCETQFGIADETNCGTAPIGPWLFSAIQNVKAGGKADYVIVSSHVASEFSPFISPRLQMFYRSLIDAGADIIHGHHSHVPQGYERYGRGFIFYGLGNYLVDAREWKTLNETWSRVVRVAFTKDGVRVSPPKVYFCATSGNVARSFLGLGAPILPCENYCEIVDRQCADKRLTAALWQEASVLLYHRIYEQILRAPSVENTPLSMRSVARKIYFMLMDMVKILFRREMPTRKSMFYARCLGNLFRCESHADMIGTALGVLSGGVRDLRNSETSALARECGL